MKTEKDNNLLNYIIYGTKLADLDSSCQQLYEEKIINDKNPQTGATLLGLAIAFARPEVVDALIKYGADINLATDIKGREGYTPITLALALTLNDFELKASDLLLPDKSWPHGEPHPDKDLADRRIQLCYSLLQHPRLNIHQADSAGKTVKAWADDWQLDSKQAALHKLLTLRVNIGLAEPYDDFQSKGDPTMLVASTNKLKPHVRI